MTTGIRLLVLDAASPVVSLAVATREPGDETVSVVGERSVEIRRSSRFLVGLLDAALGDAGLTPRDLTHLVALRGPGSFTGLRVGLSTILGLHQALGIPVAAPSNLEGLAAAAFEDPDSERVVAAVDVLRGEWVAQAFTRGPAGPTPVAEPERVPVTELERFGPGVLTGFPLGSPDDLAAAGLPVLSPPPLAPAVARLVGRALRQGNGDRLTWDADLLTRPLYFRAPAVSLPKKRRRPPRRNPESAP